MTMSIGNKMKYGLGAVAASALMAAGMSYCKYKPVSTEQPKIETTDTTKIDSAIRAEGDILRAEEMIKLNTQISNNIQKVADQIGAAVEDHRNILIKMGYDPDSLENQLKQNKQ